MIGNYQYASWDFGRLAFLSCSSVLSFSSVYTQTSPNRLSRPRIWEPVYKIASKRQCELSTICPCTTLPLSSQTPLSPTQWGLGAIRNTALHSHTQVKRRYKISVIFKKPLNLSHNRSPIRRRGGSECFSLFPFLKNLVFLLNGWIGGKKNWWKSNHDCFPPLASMNYYVSSI